MRIDVDIVTGFLASGKTSFINSLIKESIVSEEKIIVLQFENGKSVLKETKHVKVIKMDNILGINNFLNEDIKIYKPNRIIVEYNGTEKIELILNIFKEKKFKNLIKLSTIYFISSAINLNDYINNIGELLIPFIRVSNMAVINNTDSINKEVLSDAIKKMQSVNPKIYILKIPNKHLLSTKLKDSNVLENKMFRKIKVEIMNYNMYRKEE